MIQNFPWFWLFLQVLQFISLHYVCKVSLESEWNSFVATSHFLVSLRFLFSWCFAVCWHLRNAYNARHFSEHLIPTREHSGVKHHCSQYSDSEIEADSYPGSETGCEEGRIKIALVWFQSVSLLFLKTLWE